MKKTTKAIAASLILTYGLMLIYYHLCVEPGRKKFPAGLIIKSIK